MQPHYTFAIIVGTAVFLLLGFALRYLARESARVHAQLEAFETQMQICPPSEVRKMRSEVLAYVKQWCTFPHGRYTRASKILAFLDGRIAAGKNDAAASMVKVWDEKSDPVEFLIQSQKLDGVGLCLSRDGGRQPTDVELIIGALTKAANRCETGGVMSAEERRAMKLSVREVTSSYDAAYIQRCRAIAAKLTSDPAAKLA